MLVCGVFFFWFFFFGGFFLVFFCGFSFFWGGFFLLFFSFFFFYIITTILSVPTGGFVWQDGDFVHEMKQHNVCGCAKHKVTYNTNAT